ncbi:uncharacterized protein LOC119793522 [Cyprinodon tularosa]|uniref:uncharacterized protein LOC119793522 n=1 Tax=Cyprinodon tularosa TaxID=77115 RepID=UPI0018E1FDE8|nr:uncharacterized protein LOC119793522 [Cyprinodon tularosa]
MATRSYNHPWLCLSCAWVFWVTLAISISVTWCEKLINTPEISANCGDTHTLICHVTQSMIRDAIIKTFQWEFETTALCKINQNYSNSSIQCENTKTTSGQNLTLTIFNIVPKNEGVYLCKIRTTQGAYSDQSHIKVKECHGNSTLSIDNNTATCSFDQFYPSGVVHWYQGDSNLTEGSKMETKQEDNGFYKIQSELSMEKGNYSQPYNCSLWIPSMNTYVSSQLVVSSSNKGHLPPICIMAVILLRIFIM